MNEIQPEVKELMQELGRILGDVCPENFGFTLLMFDLNTPKGFMNYISNAQRQDVIVALKEFIAHAEGRKLEEPELIQ